jgi:serine/threonine-protein phosphatase 2A regulatory subunit B'
MVRPLFRRIVKCISGSHLQVADRAMCFFENECFLSLLKQYKDVTFPMLVPVINELADKHWHSVLQESLVALKSILSEIDPAAYDKALTVADREKQKNAQK